MADMQKVIQQMMNYGNTNTTNNNGKKTEWEKMMTQLAMAQKSNPQTMAGFALGRLLRQGFDSWKQNYDARGEVNDTLLSMDEDKRNARLAEIEKINPQRAAYMREHLAKKLSQNAPQTQGENQQSQGNSALRNAIMAQLNGGQQSNSLSSAPNQSAWERYLEEERAKQFAAMPTVNQPFSWR